MATKNTTEEKKVVKKPVAAKPTVKKTAVKAEPKIVAEKAEVKAVAPIKTETKAIAKKTATVDLTIDVLDLNGKSAGKLSLPVEIFGETINKPLLAQAIRVYQANKRQGNASTKTRGEVDGSTRKIYRQKGTGRARHGSLRAPIFVKGGIVHGPKPRDYSLDLPKKMRRKALFSALSSKFLGGELTVLAGLESIEPKTSIFAKGLKSLGFDKLSSILLVMPSDIANVKRATSNVSSVTTTVAGRLNALDVLKSRRILVTKDAVAEMQKLFLTKE
jgi:large subunit ribosomal protein L4